MYPRIPRDGPGFDRPSRRRSRSPMRFPFEAQYRGMRPRPNDFRDPRAERIDYPGIRRPPLPPNGFIEPRPGRIRDFPGRRSPMREEFPEGVDRRVNYPRRPSPRRDLPAYPQERVPDAPPMGRSPLPVDFAENRLEPYGDLTQTRMPRSAAPAMFDDRDRRRRPDVYVPGETRPPCEPGPVETFTPHEVYSRREIDGRPLDPSPPRYEKVFPPEERAEQPPQIGRGFERYQGREEFPPQRPVFGTSMRNQGNVRDVRGLRSEERPLGFPSRREFDPRDEGPPRHSPERFGYRVMPRSNPPLRGGPWYRSTTPDRWN